MVYHFYNTKVHTTIKEEKKNTSQSSEIIPSTKYVHCQQHMESHLNGTLNFYHRKSVKRHWIQYKDSDSEKKCVLTWRNLQFFKCQLIPFYVSMFFCSVVLKLASIQILLPDAIVNSIKLISIIKWVTFFFVRWRRE